MKKNIFLFLFPFQLLAQPFSKDEISHWQQQANHVSIIRDNYGIRHIYGKTDAAADDLLLPLLSSVNALDEKFGRWQVPWGRINRFQRISSDIDNKFDDNKASIPVGFVSSTWGMLPSYTSKTFPGTIKRYGVNGNSFICAVEFGKKIKARSLLAGGESGDENSKHFFDQGQMYSKGQFKDVLFYKEDVMKHVERSYHPGD